MTTADLRVSSDVRGAVTDNLDDERAKTVCANRAVSMASALSAATLLASVLIARPLAAGSVNSPECRRDLAMADQLVHAVRLRETSVKPGDFAGLCRLLRQNLQDMSRAREPMYRCLTGHDHGENVGQMDASIGDIRTVLAKHCSGR